ncbi:transposable element Tcb2 transposase [Trichonephila clavipes]|nr:transposable element Tcb2 transposase [Trichonephila clavipes]
MPRDHRWNFLKRAKRKVNLPFEEIREGKGPYFFNHGQVIKKTPELATSHRRTLRHAGRRAVFLVRWIVQSEPLEIVGAVDTRRYPRAESRVWSDQEDHDERGSKDQAASTYGPHRDSFNDTSRHWQKAVFSDESRFVLGTDDNRVRVWRRPGPFLNELSGAIFQQDNARPQTARVAQDFLRHFQTLPWPAHSPELSSVEHVWDQLKQQMPSCHSVRDLELAVKDLRVHLPHDNIRCLINSIANRVAACIVAGGGRTCY